MTDEDVQFLVCQPFLYHLEIDLYPESVIKRATCGHLVWVAQAGMRVWDASYPICLTCFQASEFPDTIERKVAPGAFQDIERLFGKEYADKTRRDFNEGKGFRG